MSRGAEALLVPQLHVVVPAGLVQGAAAVLQPLAPGLPATWHGGVHLREAGLAPGAVVGVLDGLVLPVAGGEAELLPDLRGRGSAAVAGHFQEENSGFFDGKHAVQLLSAVRSCSIR